MAKKPKKECRSCEHYGITRNAQGQTGRISRDSIHGCNGPVPDLSTILPEAYMNQRSDLRSLTNRRPWCSPFDSTKCATYALFVPKPML